MSHQRARVLALALALELPQCDSEPSGPGALAVAADGARTGADGGDGPSGAARVQLHAQSRVTDALDIEVTYPAGNDGALAPRAAPYPAVVLVTDARVAPARYRWVASHLATRGFVVAAPSHPADTALFAMDNARLALDALCDAARDPAGTLYGAVDPSAGATVLGHGAGGAVAANAFRAGVFSSLALLAGDPGAGATAGERGRGPSLALVAASDGRAPRERYLADARSLPAPRIVAVVEALDHYDFTDEPTALELASDGAPAPVQGVARRNALRVLDDWMDATLRSDLAAASRLARGRYRGVSVPR